MELFSLFLGTWTLTRTVFGGAQCCVARATGSAVFSATSETGVLLFREQGQLQMTAAVDAAPAHATEVSPVGDTGMVRAIPFSRRFRYIVQGDSVEVLFADGVDSGKSYQRYCWSASQRALLPVAEHACLADCYSSRYHFPDASHFTMDTSIRGPHKNQTLRTIFVKTSEIDGQQ